MKFDTLKYVAIGSVSTLTVISILLLASGHLNEPPRSSPLSIDSPINNDQQPEIRQSPMNADLASVNAGVNSEDGNIEVSHNVVAPPSVIEQGECAIDCLRTLTQKIVAGITLDTSEGVHASNNAQKIADLLAGTPDQVLSFEAALSATDNPDGRDVLLFILSKLSKEHLLQSAQRLSYSASVEDRIAGLSLLEASIGSDSDFGQELTTLINSETNEEVLVRAMKIVEELPPETIDSLTHTRLSTLIDHSDSEKIVSAALLAKISFVADDEDVRKNISDVLQVESGNLNLVGLQALGKVLERQQYKPERGNWQQDVDVKENVLAIANNVDASPALRIEALNLVNRHFL